MIVIVVVVVVPVIVAVVAIRVIGAVVIICTAIYAPMNTPMMAVVGLCPRTMTSLYLGIDEAI